MENHRETEFFKNLIKRMQNNNGVNLEKKWQDTDQSVRNNNYVPCFPREKIFE